MKDLFIYHPGTGTVISLSDEVYVCDTADIDIENAELIPYIPIQDHKGYRIDNYNMTNLFFGGNE